MRLAKICHSWTRTNFYSSDGCFLGYGSSDLTIGVVDAKTLSVLDPLYVTLSQAQTDKIFQPVFTILKAHDFPPTTLKFNPTTTLLVSSSADNTVRIVSLQYAAGSFRKCSLLVTDKMNIKFSKAWTFIFVILLAILVAVLALFAKQYTGAIDFKW